MMRRCLWLALLLLPAGACSAETAEEAYARLNERLLAAKSLTGTLELSQTGRKTIFTFRLLRPNYSSTVTTKYESHGDGKTEWFYTRGSRQFESQPASTEMAPAAPLLGLEAMFRDKAPTDYKAVSLSPATFAGISCRKILLTAKDDPSAKLRLYLDPASGMPVGWQVEEKGPTPDSPSVSMTGHYRDLRLDVPLEPGDFAWKPPAGAKTMDILADLLKVGSVAPPFTLRTPEGVPVSLANTVKRNKATMVNFWFYG